MAVLNTLILLLILASVAGFGFLVWEMLHDFRAILLEEEPVVEPAPEPPPLEVPPPSDHKVHVRLMNKDLTGKGELRSIAATQRKPILRHRGCAYVCSHQDENKTWIYRREKKLDA